MFATKVNVLRVAVVIAVAEASTASLRVPSADSRGVHAGCSSDLDCSLNGKCAANKCICDKPWTGDQCGIMAYKVTPASAKDVYPITDLQHNTWNGPSVGPAPEDGQYHIYVPLYAKGALGGAKVIKHGTAASPTGPYTWDKLPDIPGSQNPAFVVFTNSTTGKLVYSLWDGDRVLLSANATGPFSVLDGFSYPGGNPAPIYHKGAFYYTNQKTFQIYTTPRMVGGAVWTVYANVSHTNVASGTHPEDPFMWVDKRGNWHIINHAYDTTQKQNCGSSVVSDHFFSTDGKDWHLITGLEPYSHTVQYDDGTNHTYTTLERPNILFDVDGQMTHLNLAADLVTGDEGCAPTCCTNCKWHDHAGTIVVALDV